MQQEHKLYEYLYQSLVSQIESGTFMSGQTLPSQKELCSQFNVGITTVRKVIKLLDRDGYIRSEAGRPAVVIYQASSKAYIAAVAQRADEIRDAYQGLGLIMPALYQEGARLCGGAEIKKMYQIIEKITDRLELPALYQHANAFFTTLIQPLHNQLAMDLELDAENFLHVPYISLPGTKNPFELTAGQLKTWLKNAVTQIEQKRFESFQKNVKRFYRESERKVEEYFGILSEFVTAPAQEKEIHWFRVKGRSELYTSLAMNLMRRMTAGEFDGQKYLPSIPKLMEEYKVVKDTASRAVALLNAMGAAKTINKKGTVIILSGTQLIGGGGVNWKDPVVRQRLSMSLDALQIMALIVRHTAQLGAAPPEKWVLGLENTLNTAVGDKICPLSVQYLMYCSIQTAPCHSLKNIYQQLDELVMWGHYLQSVDKSFYPDSSRVITAMRNVIATCKGGDKNAFANMLGEAFLQIYFVVQSVYFQLIDEKNLSG